MVHRLTAFTAVEQGRGASVPVKKPSIDLARTRQETIPHVGVALN